MRIKAPDVGDRFPASGVFVIAGRIDQLRLVFFVGIMVKKLFVRKRKLNTEFIFVFS